MTQRLEIYGASDDLVEVEGALTEEFNPELDAPATIGISDGTLLEIQYTGPGVWRITPILRGPALREIIPAQGPDGPHYSDRAILEQEEPFAWVIVGAEHVRAKEGDLRQAEPAAAYDYATEGLGGT